MKTTEWGVKFGNEPKPIHWFRDSNVNSVKVIKVIEVKSITGDGLDEPHTPIREVTEYFTLDGERIHITDTYAEKNKLSKNPEATDER